MAELFDFRASKKCRLLDAGSGIGVLSAAFLERITKGEFSCNVEANAFELDTDLIPYLSETLAWYARHQRVDVNIQQVDFIDIGLVSQTHELGETRLLAIGYIQNGAEQSA